MPPSSSSRLHLPAGRPSSAVLLLLAGGVALPACGVEGTFEIENPTGLPPGILFRVGASPTEIAAGEEMTVVVRVENTNDHEVSLRFPTTCTVLFLVEDPDGARVFPQEGNECPDATAPGPDWHLAPHQEIERRFTWTGVRERDGVIEPAASGDYRLFGAMGPDPEIRTLPREVTIR